MGQSRQWSSRAIADLLAGHGITDVDVDQPPNPLHGFELISPLVIKNTGRCDLNVYVAYDPDMEAEYFEIWTPGEHMLHNGFGFNELVLLLQAILKQ